MSADSNKTPALIAATLTSFLTPFMGSAVNIALPTIGKQFDLDAIWLSWVTLSFSLAAAVFLVPFGKLADIHGRKRIFAIGTLLFTVSTFLVGISTSAAMLIAFRVTQGIGSAMIFGTGVAILTSVYEPGERGRVLGINVAAVYLGLSLGPSIGGLLTEQLGWRSVFLVTVPLGLAAVAYVAWGLKGEWAEARGESFDLAGSAIYSVALIAIMLGFSRLPKLLGGGLILAGLAGIGLFVAWETRTRSPVLDVGLFLAQSGLCLFQPGRPDQLQRHCGGWLSAEPVSPVYQGADAAAGRFGPDCPADHAGPVFAPGRTVVRQGRAPGGGLDGHGHQRRRPFPPRSGSAIRPPWPGSSFA